MNTKEVTEISGMSFAFCSRWAKNNSIGRIMKKGISAYEWTDADVQKFLKRRGKKRKTLPLRKRRKNKKFD